MREAIATVVGWVDPVSAQPVRRSEEALKMWRYYNPKFSADPVYFAVEGVNSATDALEVGYELVTAKVGIEVRREEENETEPS